MKRIILVLMLVGVLCPSVAAQGPSPTTTVPAPAPKVGMAPWAYALAIAGPASNVATSEYAFYHFGVYNQAVKQRVALGVLNMSLPFIAHRLLRHTDRADANVEACILAAWGFKDTGMNLHILITLHPGGRK